MTDTAPPVHRRLRGKIDLATERLALQAALTAAHLLGLAAGTHLRKLRNLSDPLAELQARIEEAEMKARLAWETAEILTARFAKVPERHRPHFTAAQRFRILEIRSLLAWNAHHTAKTFLVCANTILNWERSADPNARTVGASVKPTPPIRRAADVVRSIARRMAALGFGGQDLCSRVLARAGWRVSARSIGRYRREWLVVPPPTPAVPPKKTTHPVVARFVHHVWMMDVSHVRQFLGGELFMATVFDSFSRVPLTLQVFETKPGAKDMAQLLRLAAKAFARPRYVITDQGGEFTAGAFRKAVARLGATQRFAAKDSIYATARLERFWRTLKDNAGLYRLHLPLTAEDVERRLQTVLLHYLAFRPHEGLKGATPAETFLGLEPACLRAVDSPRALPGDVPAHAPFQATSRGLLKPSGGI